MCQLLTTTGVHRQLIVATPNDLSVGEKVAEFIDKTTTNPPTSIDSVLLMTDRVDPSITLYTQVYASVQKNSSFFE